MYPFTRVSIDTEHGFDTSAGTAGPIQTSGHGLRRVASLLEGSNSLVCGETSGSLLLLDALQEGALESANVSLELRLVDVLRGNKRVGLE